MVATRSCTRHFVEQVASDGVAGVGRVLGYFHAESVDGPKMKFDLLLMLSNFD
jgi:hypothetical protein